MKQEHLMHNTFFVGLYYTPTRSDTFVEFYPQEFAQCEIKFGNFLQD